MEDRPSSADMGGTMQTFESSSVSASLELRGVLLDENKVTSPLTFTKVALLPEDFIYETSTGMPGPGRPTPRRRGHAEAPIPDIHHDLPFDLSMKTGKFIGGGRSGVVFEVEPVNLRPPYAALPPLVAKFARQHYNKWLLREAWFYEEMQSLQGVVIPWCYGLYHVRVPVSPNHVFAPWLSHWQKRMYGGREVSLDELMKTYVECDGMDGEDESLFRYGSDEKYLDCIGNFKDQYEHLVDQFEEKREAEQRTIVVTMLVLEKLGGPYLPKGGTNWPMGLQLPESITRDVYDAYHEIHELGIVHMDIRRANILAVPEQEDMGEQNGLGGREEPDLKKPTYKCRIIDFELAQKTLHTTASLDMNDSPFLDRLIHSLPQGRSIGQQLEE